eukprot:8562987-Heterocapsa_arctica.AAC.1
MLAFQGVGLWMGWDGMGWDGMGWYGVSTGVDSSTGSSKCFLSSQSGLGAQRRTGRCFVHDLRGGT